MEEISVDNGCLSKANLQTAVDNNAVPYIAWKANSRETNKEGNHLWNRYITTTLLIKRNS